MTLQRFPNPDRLAIGVLVPADNGPVLSGSAPELTIGSWNTSHLRTWPVGPVCASDLVPKRCPEQPLRDPSHILLGYFPL
jgi:hypothetical protein